MTGLMDKATKINYIIRSNFPGSCHVWPPICGVEHIRFRVKCKNIRIFCVELTCEEVMRFPENEVASFLMTRFINLLLERIENNGPNA